MTRDNRGIRWLVVLATFALVAAACGGDEGGGDGDGAGTTGGVTGGATGATAPDLSGESVEIAATWTSSEKDNFEQVLAAFGEQTGADVTFLSAGDDVAAFVGPRIEGGDPPDVAILPQPGVLASFAEQGDLVAIEDVAGDLVDENLGPAGRQVGEYQGTLYGVWFKAAQKSTVWYNVNVFNDAGVEPPATWEELLQVGQTISDFGVAPYSIGADVGWPLTDLFENIYVRTAGAEKYAQLASHEIPWTDQSVKDALTLMGDILGDPDLLAGGTQGALQTDFNGSITQAFADPPQGAIIFEGDFVGGIINDETDAELGPDADFFDFPSIDGSPPGVVGGGDIAVLLDDTPGGRALIQYLASTEAGELRASLGGFISPNQNVPLDAYPDDVTRRAAEAFQAAGDEAVYDLSDLQPTAFGATTGQGLWGIFTDFLENPSDVDGTAQALEDAANDAYGGS